MDNQQQQQHTFLLPLNFVESIKNEINSNGGQASSAGKGNESDSGAGSSCFLDNRSEASGSEDSKQVTKLFVGNLPTSTTLPELLEVFKKYGPVNEKLSVVKDQNYAFIHFYNRRDAEVALREVNDSLFKDRYIRVQFSTSQGYTHNKNRTQIERQKLFVGLRDDRDLPTIYQNQALSASSASLYDSNGLNGSLGCLYGQASSSGSAFSAASSRPIIGKLSNVNNYLARQSSYNLGSSNAHAFSNQILTSSASSSALSSLARPCYASTSSAYNSNNSASALAASFMNSSAAASHYGQDLFFSSSGQKHGGQQLGAAGLNEPMPSRTATAIGNSLLGNDLAASQAQQASHLKDYQLLNLLYFTQLQQQQQQKQNQLQQQLQYQQFQQQQQRLLLQNRYMSSSGSSSKLTKSATMETIAAVSSNSSTTANPNLMLSALVGSQNMATSATSSGSSSSSTSSSTSSSSTPSAQAHQLARSNTLFSFGNNEI